MMLVSVLGTVLAASAAVVPVGAIPCNHSKQSGLGSPAPSPVAVEKPQVPGPVQLPNGDAQPATSSQRPKCIKRPSTGPAAVPQKNPEQNGPVVKGASGGDQNGAPNALPCTKCAEKSAGGGSQPTVKAAATPDPKQDPPASGPKKLERPDSPPAQAGQPSAPTKPCAKCAVNGAVPGPTRAGEPSPSKKPCLHKGTTKSPEAAPGPIGDKKAPEQPTGDKGPAPAPAPGQPGQVGSPTAKPTCSKKAAGSPTPAPVKPASVPGQSDSPSKKPNLDDVTPAPNDVKPVGKNGTPKKPDVDVASKPEGEKPSFGPSTGSTDDDDTKPKDGPAPPGLPGSSKKTGEGAPPAPPGPSTPTGGKQSNLGKESVDKPGSVGVTPHQQYSSSVGALGCMLNTNRVAYWPGSPGCNDICMKLTSDKTGRSLHLLRIDTSGGDARDISYEAWNELTGMKAGGKEPMTWEWADMSACSDLLFTPSKKMPIAAYNGIGWPSSCLAKAEQEGSSPNWLSQNYELFNHADARCENGPGDACTFDMVTKQIDCGKTSAATGGPGPGVKDIEYMSLPDRP